MSQAITNATIASVELRRRREQTDQLLKRAAYLAPNDRLVIEQVYRNGVAIKDLAGLTGNPPRSMRRRIVRLLRRLNSPLYSVAISKGHRLDEATYRTVQLVVCQGLSLRQASASTGYSLHRVRQHIRQLYELASQ